jgi:hypothetical protein
MDQDSSLVYFGDNAKKKHVFTHGRAHTLSLWGMGDKRSRGEQKRVTLRTFNERWARYKPNLYRNCLLHLATRSLHSRVYKGISTSVFRHTFFLVGLLPKMCGYTADSNPLMVAMLGFNKTLNYRSWNMHNM